MKLKPTVVLDLDEMYDIKRIAGFADAAIHADPDKDRGWGKKRYGGGSKYLTTLLYNLSDPIRGGQYHDYEKAFVGLIELRSYLEPQAEEQYWLDMTGDQKISEYMVANVKAQLRDLEPVLALVNKGLALTQPTE